MKFRNTVYTMLWRCGEELAYIYIYNRIIFDMTGTAAAVKMHYSRSFCYSTVTDFAKFRGLSTSSPMSAEV